MKNLSNYLVVKHGESHMALIELERAHGLRLESRKGQYTTKWRRDLR